MRSPRTLRTILLITFTVSGFSGLIYESIWSHYLQLILGHAAYAQSLVLALFMGGMALGAWLAGRRSAGWANPLRAYALIEGFISVLALAFHGLFVQATDLLHTVAIPALAEPWQIQGVKWTLATLLILPQSILLGMTFPLMSAAIIRFHSGSRGATLALLYFTNSIGGAIGVLVSGFVLIEFAGLPGTVLTAGLLNAALALYVWRLSAGREDPPIESRASRGVIEARPVARVVLLVALLTGAASFFYEIGWIRMLSLVLGSTTHAFELMLSAFIAGLAFGGLWIRRRIDLLPDLLRYTGGVQLAMGVCALLTLPMYDSSFDVMAWLVNNLPRTDPGYALFNLGSHALAIAIMLPATFMAGMVLPLLTAALLRLGQGEASIGRLYSANTLGAIVGVMLAVHVIMPMWGVKWVIIVGAAIDILLGLVLLRMEPAARYTWVGRGVVAMPVLLAIAVASGIGLDRHKMASGVYRHGQASLSADEEITYYQDGKTASINLRRSRSGLLTISTNGKPDAAIAPLHAPHTLDEVTMVLLAAVPLSINPQARLIGNIGMGSGLTTHTLLASPHIERVDTVEIEPKMVEAARGFGGRVERAFTDPRSHIVIDDAKSFFSASKRQYDIIVSEPSNPWVSGVSGLFTEEFYASIKRSLAADGILVQWLHLYESNLDLASSVFKALASQFNHYVVYSTDFGDILIIARAGRKIPDPGDAIFAIEPLRAELARINIDSLDDIEIRRIASSELLNPLFEQFQAPANSDFYPYLSYAAPHARYLRQTAGELPGLKMEPVPVLDLLAGRDRPVLSAPRAELYLKYARGDRALDVVNRLSMGESDESAQRFDYIVHALSGLDAACTPEKDASIDDAGFKLAALINHSLSSRQTVELWDLLISRQCIGMLGESTRKWFGLHRAVAAADAPMMIARSNEILATAQLSDPKRNRYLLSAGLTGYLMQGDHAGARAFWRANAASIETDDEMPLVLRLLQALIYAHA